MSPVPIIEEPEDIEFNPATETNATSNVFGSSNEMSPVPIIEEPDDIEFNPVTRVESSNEFALSGNNTAQELAVLNASGKNDLSACIAGIKVPERQAQVQSSGVGVLDFIPVVNVINRAVETGVNCHHNNKNRETYNQESIRYHQTVREVAQNEVDSVEKQCSTIRETHSKQCDTAIQLNASGKNDLSACITGIKVPERPAQVQITLGIDCYQNNQNRDSYNQEVRQYHQTVRELAQKGVARVEKQIEMFRVPDPDNDTSG